MRRRSAFALGLSIVRENDDPVLVPLRVIPATTFLQRLVGLLGRKSWSDRKCLWLSPCSSIHTFGMRFTIDVVFVDKGMRVLGFSDAVPPNRIRVAPKGTASVLELSEGNRRRTGINLDDLLNFDLMDSQPNKQE